MGEQPVEARAAMLLTDDEIVRLRAYARSLRREVHGDVQWLQETAAVLRRLRGDRALLRATLTDGASQP